MSEQKSKPGTKSADPVQQNGRFRTGMSPMKEGALALGLAAALAGCGAAAQGRSEEPTTPQNPSAATAQNPERGSSQDGAQSIARVSLEVVSGEAIGGATVLRAEITPEPEAATYHWFVYLHHPVAESGNTELTSYVLLNPRYAEPDQQRYIGIALPNVQFEDGTSGEAVVRVRTQNPQMRPTVLDIVYGSEGRPEVLFRLRSGTLDPIMDETLTQNMSAVAIETSRPAVVVLWNEPMRAAVIVEAKVTSARQLE